MFFGQVPNNGPSLLDLEPIRDGLDDLLDLASALRDLDHLPGILPHFSTFQSQVPSPLIPGSFPLLPNALSLECEIYLISEFLHDQIWVPRCQHLYHILAKSPHDVYPIHDLDLSGADLRVAYHKLSGVGHPECLECAQQVRREALSIEVL